MKVLNYVLSLLLVLSIFATPALAQGTTYRPLVGQSCNPSNDADYIHPSNSYLNLYCKKPSYYPASWNYYHYGYDWDAAYGDNTKYQTLYNDVDNDGVRAWSDLDDDGDGYNDYVEWEVCLASGTGCASPSTSSLNNAAVYEPFAVIASPADGSNFAINTPITLDASGSMGSSSGVLRYSWDFDYDGNSFTIDSAGTSPTTSHTYTSNGARTVGLRVSDGSSYSVIETIQITIGTLNTPPTILSQQIYSDSTLLHEFTVLAQASDVDGNLDTCTLYHRLQGQTTWTSEQGNLNTNTGMCSGTIDNVNDSYNVGDTVETYITFADTVGATVNTTLDSHDIPNQAPSIAEVNIQGNNISEGNDSWNTFGITITDLDDPENDATPTSSLLYQWYEGTLGF